MDESYSTPYTASRKGSYPLESQEITLHNGVLRDPVVLLVDNILYKAIEIRASDIHLEPSVQDMRIRYRIDGILYDQESVMEQQALAALSRLKVLASIDIAQRRVPQDGKFIVHFVCEQVENDRQIDLRVSTFPSLYGEKMVIRILDRRKQHISLESLGCNQQVLEKVRTLIRRPHGFFLVTGPTGSGKTTTLYAVLSKLNQSERNIVTMEDPIEYHIDGVTQSQINEKAGFTFECGLRSLLRQDPDVAMIGEIRDKETAQIAIEAALTGHMVLSTLHTNDSVGAITRLLDMDIEPFLLTASLSGVMAQRLVRKLCSHCKRQVALNDRELSLAKKYGWKLSGGWQASGCQKCFYLGYKGRIGLFELLLITDSIRDLIIKHARTEIIRFQALHDGMTLLQSDGVDKVKQGIISFDELLRVIALE